MNINKKLLLTLSSVALLLAAPLAAQDQTRRYYALDIQMSADELFIGGGSPTVPVGLIVGLKEQFIPLPGDATLRLVPETVFILGQFNMLGDYSLPLHIRGLGPSDPPVSFLVQAFSAQDEVAPFKICTSELLSVRTDFKDHWEFKHLN